MKKVLLFGFIVALMSACAGNSAKTQAIENDSIVVIEEVVDTVSVDTMSVDSL